MAAPQGVESREICTDLEYFRLAKAVLTRFKEKER